MRQKQTVVVAAEQPDQFMVLSLSIRYHVVELRSAEALTDYLRHPENSASTLIISAYLPHENLLDWIQSLRKLSNQDDLPIIIDVKEENVESLPGNLGEAGYEVLIRPYERNTLMSRVGSAIDKFERLNQVSETLIKQVEANRDLAQKVIKKSKHTEKVLQLDLETHQAIHEFILESLDYTDYEELVQALLNATHRFAFDSAKSPSEPDERKKLRCSVRISGEKDISMSDRGVQSKLDQSILQKAMDQRALVQQGSYTAISSDSGRTALMIRNTPTDAEEKDQAINIIIFLLERFEERLKHFEAELDLANRNLQIKEILESVGGELDSINQKQLEMKEEQMEILEESANEVIRELTDLSPAQQTKMRDVINKQLIKSMELYTMQDLTDQKFLLAIEELKQIFGEQASESFANLTPGKLGGTSQEEVNNLLASLGIQ